MLPYFGVFDYIAYKVDRGTVTLLGQVVRSSLKSDAENVVKRIEGVKRVDNQVEILPPPLRMIGFAGRCFPPSISIRLWSGTKWACKSRSGSS